jgi:transposase
MMLMPAGVKVHLALGVTDMRKGMDGLATLVQETLKKDPFSGHLFAFRGRRANMIKILFWDGTGLCMFTKRIDRGYFVWPRVAVPGNTIPLTTAQLACSSKGSTGGIQNACGGPQKRAETRSGPINWLRSVGSVDSMAA